MRFLSGVFHAFIVVAGLGFFAGAASAADDEGRIRQIDTEALTITLDNGNTYRLPGEFNLEALVEGAEVVVAYETVEGVKEITDIVIYD